MFQKNKKIFFFIGSFFLISLFISFKYQDVSLKKILIDLNSSKGKSYYLKPIYKAQDLLVTENEIAYPHAKISPKSIFYRLMIIIDRINVSKANFDNLFYAEKKITELYKWGNDLNVLGNIKEINQLIKDEKDYSSWESILSEYLVYVDKEIEINQTPLNHQNAPNSMSDYEILVKLKKNLEHNQIMIEQIIFNSNKNQSEKEYLSNLVSKIFNYLSKKVNKAIPLYESNKIYYSLKNIFIDQEFGIYKVSIDKSNFPSYLNSGNKIQINQSEFAQNSLVDDNLITFPNIEINKNSTLITLILRNIYIPLKEILWKENYDKEKSVYFYTYTLPLIKEPNNLLLVFRSNLRSQSILLLDHFITENGQEKTSELFKKNLYIGQKTPVKYIFNYETLNNSYYQLILISSLPLSKEELSTVQIELDPITEPDLIIEKVSSLPNKDPVIFYTKTKNNQYLIELNNSTSYYDQLLYKSLRLWQIISKKRLGNSLSFKVEFLPAKLSNFFVMTTCFLALLLLSWQFFKKIQEDNIAKLDKLLIDIKLSFFDKINLLIKKSSGKFTVFLKYIGNKIVHIRFLLLMITLLLMLLDFASIINYYFIFYAVLLLLILVSISYRLEEKIIFSLMILFLIFCMLFFILKKFFVTEKFAMYSFTFIIIGGILSIVYKISNITDKISLSRFYDLIITDLSSGEYWGSILINLRKNLLVFLSVSHKKIVAFCVPSPDQLDKLLSLPILKGIANKFSFGRKVKLIVYYLYVAIKGSFLLLITMVIVVSFLLLRKEIKHNLYRSSLNPVIFSAKPEIIYQENKVLIKGYNFGWKQYNQVKLMSKYGEVDVGPDLWTDSSIIFPVPLHWQSGEINLWVEKKEKLEGKNITVKSNLIKIKLISRTDEWNKDDDEYFEQLKYLDKDVLKLNGY